MVVLTRLEPLLGSLGAILGSLGAILASLGLFLGRSWPLLRRSWAVLGPSWADLGASWPGLGSILGTLGPTWGGLRAVLGDLRAVLGGLGAVLGGLGAILERPKSIKKSIRNRTAQKVAPRSPQDRPRPPQDAPRTPQEPPRCPPGPPWTAQNALPDPPGRPKRLFRSTWPSTFFRRGSLYNGRRKNRKIRNRRKQVEKKVDNGHPRWSLQIIPHKNPKNFHNGRTPRGWRRWSREALFNNIFVLNIYIYIYNICSIFIISKVIRRF